MEPSTVLTPIIMTIGATGVFGFLVGFAVKRMAKIAAFIGGGIVILIYGLQQLGIIGTVNYQRIQDLMMQAINYSTVAIDHMVNTVNTQVHNNGNMPVSGMLSFTGGFILALRH